MTPARDVRRWSPRSLRSRRARARRARVDVLRTPGWISEDDSRFQSAPCVAPAVERARSAGDARPLRDARIEDDLRIDAPSRSSSGSSPGEADQGIDPEKEDRWAKLQFDLTTQSRENPDVERRVRAPEPHGRDAPRALPLRLAGSTQRAPDERDRRVPDRRRARSAKRRRQAQPRACPAGIRPDLFPSDAPDTGGAHGQESGQGRAGSGY